MGLLGLTRTGHDETITLTDFQVHFSTNTAGAAAELSVCLPRNVGDAAFGNGTPKDLGDYCRDLRPIKGDTRMHVGPFARGEYLILTVRPTEPGTATIDDIALSYRRDGSHLFQRGTQHIDEVRILTVKAT